LKKSTGRTGGDRHRKRDVARRAASAKRRAGSAARRGRSKKPIVRCAIYTRQSTSAQNRVLSSCDAQFGTCHDYVRAQADSFWRWIGRRFDDVGESGASIDRPALRRLLEHVHNGDIDAIVVYRLDRLTRSLLDSVAILNTLREASVKLLIVTAPELGSAATDKLLLNMMATFAEFERDMIRSRLADAREALKQHGRRLGGRVPYGYDTDPRTKQFVINFDEARRVEAMFELALGGMLPSDIAAEANRLGWRTKQTVAQRSRKVSGGGPWTPRQVLAVLRNPVYVGRFADEGRTRHGQHDAIVPFEVFDQVQDRLDARRTSTRPRRSKEEVRQWPLRGRIACPRCGRTMSTHSTCHGNITYRHYRCRSHAGGRPPCKGVGFPAYEIEKCVVCMLADPELADAPLDVAPGYRLLLRRFQIAWDLLDLHVQMRLLPQVVERIEYSESTYDLTVHVDREGLARFVKDNPPAPKARKTRKRKRR